MSNFFKNLMKIIISAVYYSINVCLLNSFFNVCLSNWRFFFIINATTRSNIQRSRMWSILYFLKHLSFRRFLMNTIFYHFFNPLLIKIIEWTDIPTRPVSSPLCFILRQFFDETFTGKWIGSGSSVEWTTKSTNLFLKRTSEIIYATYSLGNLYNIS